MKQIEELDAWGFAGFELEPFTGFIDLNHDPVTRERVLSVGTREYFRKLKTALGALESRGMQLDLGDSSGWPPAGPHISVEDSIPDLVFTELIVSGGRTVKQALPAPEPGLMNYLNLLIELLWDKDMANFVGDKSELLAVVAARKTGGKRSGNPLNLSDTVILDETGVVDLSGNVVEGEIVWNAPEGEWVIIAAWRIPSAMPSGINAFDEHGYTLDHLDAQQVRRHLEFMFGEDTGLAEHFGKGVRGIFMDSPEFAINRMVSGDILDEFAARRGYSLVPYIPALAVEGAHHIMAHILDIRAAPSYRLTGYDERIRHDYELTISDLFLERYVGELTDWSHRRDMEVTAEIYGMEIDLLRALGAVDVPQTEQLFAGGNELFLKLASAAAALYGREIVAAETFVAANRDYAMAPRRLKALADKVFVNGVNQVHYHGVTYPWESETYAPYAGVPFFPFSMPGNPVTFSFNATPHNVFWPDLKPLNAYISRSQYLLRQGSPDIDVLVYYPFLGVPFSYKGEAFLQEPLFHGYLPDADPPFEHLSIGAPDWLLPDSVPDTRVPWLETMRALTSAMDRQGITWSWFNDHALLENHIRPGRLPRSGAAYRAVLVADVGAIPHETIERLTDLAADGIPLYFLGKTPVHDPGFHELETRDAAVRHAMETARNAANVRFVEDGPALVTDLSRVSDRTLAYLAPSDVRILSRRLGDGRSLHFLTNLTPSPAALEARPAAGRALWWFDALAGKASPVNMTGTGTFGITLEPFGSRFLMAGLKRPDSLTLTDDPCDIPAPASATLYLEEWSLRHPSGEPIMSLNHLPDWRDLDTMKHHEGPADYVAEVRFDDPEECATLDLGLVQGAAEVYVNGQFVERLAFHPFTVEIGPHLKPGASRLKIRLYPPQRNAFIGLAGKGDKRYTQFKNREDQLVAAGLLGPVALSQRSRYSP